MSDGANTEKTVSEKGKLNKKAFKFGGFMLLGVLICLLVVISCISCRQVPVPPPENGGNTELTKTEVENFLKEHPNWIPDPGNTVCDVLGGNDIKNISINLVWQEPEGCFSVNAAGFNIGKLIVNSEKGTFIRSSDSAEIDVYFDFDISNFLEFKTDPTSADLFFYTLP